MKPVLAVEINLIKVYLPFASVKKIVRVQVDRAILRNHLLLTIMCYFLRYNISTPVVNFRVPAVLLVMLKKKVIGLLFRVRHGFGYLLHRKIGFVIHLREKKDCDIDR